MNIFEEASRKSFRYQSPLGLLSTENLWELPLKANANTRNTKADLDGVGRALLNELKAETEESLVEISNNAKKSDLETKLEIVKHIIAEKQLENAKAIARVERSQKRRKILDALSTRENEELSKASKEELLKQLEELDV